MPRHVIDSPADPRLEPYRHLKDTNQTRWANRFVAEGDKLVLRLLERGWPMHSVLATARFADRLPPVAAELPVFVAEPDLIETLIGFRYHRGVLACGFRPEPTRLADALPPSPKPCRLVVCPSVHDPENLGAMLRLSHALGVDAVLVGPACPDVFSRRVLRVSMGAVLEVPVIRPPDLAAALVWLRDSAAVELIATVCDPNAESLPTAAPSDRLAVLFGSEGHGLEPRWLAGCARRVTIPMRPGIDSLNVAVAAGIVLFHFRRQGD